MSNDLPIEKKFRILVEITRASHFAWREAALKRCPDVDPGELVNEMWDINGQREVRDPLAIRDALRPSRRRRLLPAEDLARGEVSSSPVFWFRRSSLFGPLGGRTAAHQSWRQDQCDTVEGGL